MYQTLCNAIATDRDYSRQDEAGRGRTRQDEAGRLGQEKDEEKTV